MFLEWNIDIHAGLSMREMSMADMTQIGAQVIIRERKNINNQNQIKIKKVTKQ